MTRHDQIQKNNNGLVGLGYLWAVVFYALCLATVLVFFSACSPSPQEKNEPLIYDGDLWAAHTVYEGGFGRTSYSVGPFISGDECLEWLQVEVENVQTDGGKVIFSECVEADERGLPLNPVEIQNGQDI